MALQESAASAVKQIAVLRLHLPDGTILPNQLLALDEQERVIAYADLMEEVPFCEWFRGDWFCI